MDGGKGCSAEFIDFVLKLIHAVPERRTFVLECGDQRELTIHHRREIDL